MTAANSIYSDSPELGNNRAIFISLFYYLYREIDNDLGVSSDVSKKKAKVFVKWLIHNHMCKAELKHPKEVVEIYDSIHNNEVKIFMAMEYYSLSEVTDYNKALATVVENVRVTNPHINLSNSSIMSDNSPTKDLIADIFQKIDECEIFIADITTNNPNVLYEYGYAKGLKKKIILIVDDAKKPKPKSDYHNDLRFSFRGNTDLRNVLKTQICSTLRSLGFEVEE